MTAQTCDEFLTNCVVFCLCLVHSCCESIICWCVYGCLAHVFYMHSTSKDLSTCKYHLQFALFTKIDTESGERYPKVQLTGYFSS